MTSLIHQFQIIGRALNEDFPEHSSLKPVDTIVRHRPDRVSSGLHAPNIATQSSWYLGHSAVDVSNTSRRVPGIVVAMHVAKKGEIP
jgi:hypothetical protein